MPLHTDRLYETQLGKLRVSALEMGGLVEQQIAQAIRALVTADEPLARATIARSGSASRPPMPIRSWPARRRSSRCTSRP